MQGSGNDTSTCSRPLAPGPLFSVVTPTRNRAHAIHRMYESLLAQTLRDFEWIVVDNASTDGTAELLSRWCEDAPFPIRYFRREANAGALASLNLALAHAAGTLFLYTRDADTIMPTALERFKLHWNAIPPDDRGHYVGISPSTASIRTVAWSERRFRSRASTPTRSRSATDTVSRAKSSASSARTSCAPT